MTVKRIFWFGMHKVLRRTELVQLRALGYEVFSPAYLSPVYDQSADRTIDYDQPTTLPKDVFAKLIAYNFFYNAISPSIAEILNSHFDAAIVTISAGWLKSFLAAYLGPVIYRVYGQHMVLSEQLIELDLWSTLISRDDLSIVPFAAETLDREHAWFTALCREIVPYQIPDDVFAHSATWSVTEHRPVITTHIPNIENPYYAAAYAAFRAAYPQRLFEITGPQRSHPRDSSIVGSLPRSDFLGRLASSSGFFYDYRDEVCYLTPIEMMEIGGPVLYAPGSLLDRFFDGPAPGLVKSPALAEWKLRALLKGDGALISEIVAAQEPVRRRYDRAVVQPAFAAAFRRILGEPRHASLYAVQDQVVRGAQVARTKKDTTNAVVAFLHDDTLVVRDGRMARPQGSSGEALVRCVKAITAASRFRVVVTCLERTQALVLDLFAGEIAAGQVDLHILRGTGPAGLPLADRVARLDLIADLNRRDDIATILVPDPRRFPENLLFKGQRVVYLSDYQPIEERSCGLLDQKAESEELEEATLATLRAARLVLVPTAYVKDCLAAFSSGQDVTNKVVVFPPRHEARIRTASVSRRESELFAKTAGRRFLFYPAANLPDGRYAFLMKALANARLRHPDLMLVVTDPLGRIPGVGEAADGYEVKQHVVALEGLDQADFDWLYAHAAALVWVSSFEGSLPPAIVDAVRHKLPVIASRLPPIVEAMGSSADSLLLFGPSDAEAFSAALDLALADRVGVARSQSVVLEQLCAPSDDPAMIVSLLVEATS